VTITLGPRIFVKRDSESSVGRGCVLYAAHFRPEIAMIPRAAAACAPAGTEEVWLTEGYRNIRDSPDRHEMLCALDITYRLIGDIACTVEMYVASSWAMSTYLGPNYDIPHPKHGSAPHIHCEYDPKW
jgi:hypothetical protein